MTYQKDSPTPSQARPTGWPAALSDELLQTLFDAVILTDADGLITTWSDGATRLLGWSDDEMLGLPLAMRLPQSVQPWLQAVAWQPGIAQSWEGELVETHKDGSQVVSHTRLRRLADARGGYLGILRVSRDLSQQRQAEQEARSNEALAAAALDSIPAHIVVLTSDGMIRAVNRAWRRFAAEAPAAGGEPWPGEPLGSNYVAFCQRDPTLPGEVIAGIRDVLSGLLPKFEQDYTCDGPCHRRWFRMTVTPLDHPLRGAVVAHTDITERVQSEEASRLQSERLQLALEAAQLGAWTMELGCRMVSWSPEAYRVLGRVGLPSSPQALRSWVHPDDLAGLTEKFARSMEERSRFDASFRVQCPDGSRRWMHNFGQVQLGRTGQPERMVGTLQDITEPHLARQAMLRQNRALRLIVDGAPLGDVLAEVARLIEEQLPGVLCSILVQDRTTRRLRLGSAPSLPASYNQAVDGVPIGPTHGACGTAAHRRQPVRVRDTQTDPLFADYRELAAQHGLRSCLSVPILSANFDGHGEEVVLGTFAMYRRDTDDAAGSFPAFESAAALRPRASSQQPGPPPKPADRGDGTASARSEQDLLVGAIHLARLAIERQAALQELRDSEQRFRLLVDGMTDYAVFLLDPTKRVCTWNTGAERLFGYTAAEIIGHSVEQLAVPEEIASGAIRERWARLDAQGRVEVDGWRLRKNGSRFWGTAITRALSDDRGSSRGYAVVLRDLSDRRQLEEQLRQSQKMDAVGRLAGGVAHDFNNILMIIHGYSELLLQAPGIDGPMAEAVLVIRDAGEQAAALTNQLLAFSRKAIVEPKRINLHAAACAAGRMLKRLLGEDIRLTTTQSASPSWVKVDPGQLDQVFMNLAVNAREAMPQGGSLRIETSSLILPSAVHSEFGDIAAGSYAQLVVSDTGSGIPEHVRPHIFEPFFTTKGVGSGAGLGLATVYGIVRQAGGAILVDSEPGKGTTFRILFPIEAERPTPNQPTADVPPRGTETILLVEDEDAVRQVVRLSLTMLGYNVLAAPSSRAALELAASYPAPIHLLLTDVVMPESGGRALAEALNQVRPQTKVLYMSGYTDDAVVQHGVEAATVAFLQKPFTPQHLARKVRDLLDTPLGVSSLGPEN